MLAKEEVNIKFKNYEEVSAYAQKNNKTLLVLDDYILDVTSFAQHHPGGGVLLYNQQLKSIDEQMKFHHPLTLCMANSMRIGSFKKDIERIIDPTQPLLKQVWNLDQANYLQIINSPMWLFVPSPRMFETNFFQALSHNKWYTILLLPTLLSIYLISNINSW